MSFDKCIQSITTANKIQTSPITLPQILLYRFTFSLHSRFQPLLTPDLLSVTIALPFSECRIN